MTDRNLCARVGVLLAILTASCSQPSGPGDVTDSDDSGSPRSDAGVGGDSGVDALADAPSASDGSSSNKDGGAPRDGASSDGSSVDAGSDAVVGPPPPASVCNMAAVWSTGTELSISTTSANELDSVTPDELSIAWTVGQGSSAVIEYADRATPTDSFGAPQMLASGQFTADRVALSGDGLRLVVVDAGGQGFSEMTRTSRDGGAGSTFGAATTGSYTNLDAVTLSPGQAYGDPVLSADDDVFFYSVYGATGQTVTIYRSARLLPGDAWPQGVALASSSGLDAQGSLRRRPTGLSSDEQTLFFWDEVTGTERAAWIDDKTGAFDQFVDLGNRSMAAPNAACTVLYYSALGGSNIDLYTSTD
jgi:hypothetical protein